MSKDHPSAHLSLNNSPRAFVLYSILSGLCLIALWILMPELKCVNHFLYIEISHG